MFQLPASPKGTAMTNIEAPAWTFGSQYPDSSDEEKVQDGPSMGGAVQVSTVTNDGGRHSSTKPPYANPISLFGTSLLAVDPAAEEEQAEPGTSKHNNHPSMVPFPPGFSDDEDVDGDLDRTYPGQKSKTMSRQKSPRCYDSDDEAEQSPKSKKPRKSLFKSDSVVVSSDDADDEETDPRVKNAKSVRNRISDLNITQEDNENLLDSVTGNRSAGPSKPSNFGLGFGNTSDVEDVGSQRSSPALSEQSIGFIETLDLAGAEQDHGWNYDLRKNIDREIKSTWIDQDQTANYDPTEENRKKMAELNKAKARKKKAKRGPAPKKKKKEKIKKLIARLPFKKFGNVLQRTEGKLDNWPIGWSDLDSEEEVEERQRIKRRKLFMQKPKHKPQKPIPDPKGEVNDLTGRPAARGCVDCRTSGLDCSMVEDGSWPCIDCTNEEHFCVPIIPPKVKGKCQRCQELGEGTFCSFEDEEQEQGDMCEQCLDAECGSCVAGPASGTNDRIDLDQILYGPDRQWASCTNCRQHKKRCSLKKKTDKPPCKGCKRNGIGCTFYEVPKIDLSKGKKKDALPKMGEAGAERDWKGNFMPTIAGSSLFTARDLADLENSDEEEEYVREETPEIEMSDAQGRTGIVTKIDTCFAHPIEYDILGQSTEDCSFCTTPMFGMVGHFEKTVHVLKWHNNLGYGELAGGYQDEYGRTIMCMPCVMARVQIIVCADTGHKMQPIHQDAHVTDDRDEAMVNILEAEPGSADYFYQLQRWCSMCFSLASLECCNEQAAVTDEEVIQGCGLKLCGNCEMQLREEFGEDSSAMATALELEPKWKHDDDEEKQGCPARADVGFLAKDGHLFNNVNYCTQETIDED